MIENMIIKENSLFATQIEEIFNINDEILDLCKITELATRQDFENIENKTVNYIVDKIIRKACNVRMNLNDIIGQLKEKHNENV